MQRKLVVVVNGHPRSGKDTVVNGLSEVLKEFGWLTGAISSIDPIRNVLRGLGIPVDKKTTAERDLLANMKACLEGYDNWVTRSCVSSALARLDIGYSGKDVIFLHVREPAAIALTKELLPDSVEFLTIFVDRAAAEQVSTNAADANVENYPYDISLGNNGDLASLGASLVALAAKINQSTAKVAA
ncbi:hypothetical protein [Mesorhizobium sp. M1B.F.Ca.ET.045.04.1.1]|uniref:hypothetical protein n=1 Tax=Mesorhizobium sp. M1B.F.Ca.ET.045.04.1.1 TaxID=2493673 RepID=UPI000F74E825|nr:hypothetical protein [Mesorhizobium sp. M1B.F.Ca.ET.045.04.1.1]AZO29309.1 hypothetical protein EJ071_19275 [Mesorhizobium sp. M1B.F.Ca.ET.045.04.1.1]